MSLYESYWKNAAWWQRLGIPFTLFVVGLLVYLNVFSNATVKKLATWTDKPSVWICSDTPDWAKEQMPKAMKWWVDHGSEFKDTKTGPCIDTCDLNGRSISCKKGYIVLSLRDGQLQGDHVGETIRISEGNLTWATIMVPSMILDSDPRVPMDALDITLAHELGHALGYDHTTTDIGCGMKAEKSGHLMNSSLYNSGWGDEGLPKTGGV